MGRPRIALARFIIRLGRLLQSSAIAVMRPADLVEFSRQSYAPAARVRDWGRSELVDEGLYPNEESLLAKMQVKEGHLLLLGGGGGRDAVALARRGFAVTAVDFAPAMLEQARRNAAQRGLKIGTQAQEMSRLALAADSYDIAWLSARMYSCIPTRRRRIGFLQRLALCLRPDGHVALQFHYEPGGAAPTRSRGFQRLLGWATLGYRQLEPGDMLWQQREFLHAFRDEKDLRSEFAAGGFSVLHIEFQPGILCGGAVLRKSGATA
jgi:SAM-dependent methyltransferase